MANSENVDLIINGAREAGELMFNNLQEIIDNKKEFDRTIEGMSNEDKQKAVDILRNDVHFAQQGRQSYEMLREILGGALQQG